MAQNLLFEQSPAMLVCRVLANRQADKKAGVESDQGSIDDMVATLVVNLPSRFSGGSFVIEHHGEKLRVVGSEKN
jgi:hypothetical protein